MGKMPLTVLALVLYVACVSAINFDASDVNYGRKLNSTTGATNTYAAAINYGRTHPTRDGGSWSGW